MKKVQPQSVPPVLSGRWSLRKESHPRPSTKAAVITSPCSHPTQGPSGSTTCPLPAALSVLPSPVPEPWGCGSPGGCPRAGVHRKGRTSGSPHPASSHTQKSAKFPEIWISLIDSHLCSSYPPPSVAKLLSTPASPRLTGALLSGLLAKLPPGA